MENSFYGPPTSSNWIENCVNNENGGDESSTIKQMNYNTSENKSYGSYYAETPPQSQTSSGYASQSLSSQEYRPPLEYNVIDSPSEFITSQNVFEYNPDFNNVLDFVSSQEQQSSQFVPQDPVSDSWLNNQRHELNEFFSQELGTPSISLPQQDEPQQDEPHDEAKDDEWPTIEQLRKRLVTEGLLSPESKLFEEIKSDYQFTAEQRKKAIRTILHFIPKIGDFDDKCIGILSRNSWKNIEFGPRGLGLTKGKKTYNFIRLRKRGQLVILMSRIHKNLARNKLVTKRDLFYRDKDFYITQTVCDNLIDDICCFTRLPRRSLHILACGKGLVYGDISLCVNGKTEDCKTFPSGYGLPYDLTTIENVESNAKFILIVEKDASFQHLIRSKIIEKFPLIMITGKGFPDANTRQFLHMLIECLAIPALLLVDCDPWGIEILCNYKYGSMSMAYFADTCTAPQIRWLGILPEDLLKESLWEIPDKYRIALTDVDKKKIHDLKKRKYIADNYYLSKQLEILETEDRKVDLQQIDQVSEHFLVDLYLPTKIRLGLWMEDSR